MPSKIFIVNQALMELGRLPVSAITDSEDAILISNKLDILLPEMLMTYQWNFAILFKEDSTPLTTNFSPQFPYTFQLPANYGRMVLFNNPGYAYDIVDGLLLTQFSPIQYYYLVKDVSYEVLPTVFSRALAIYAAADTCAVLTNNVQLTVFLEKKYQSKLGDAIQENDQERRIVSKPYNDFDRTQII